MCAATVYRCYEQWFVASSNRDEEEMEEYFRRKYADAAATQDMYGDGEDMADEISQQGLLPGVKWVWRYGPTHPLKSVYSMCS